MKVVVSDTSPLRALAHLGQLGLLSHLFDEVVIPVAVARELEHPTSRAVPVSVAQVPNSHVVPVAQREHVDQLRELLDPGESEAITLALELGIAEILVDEAAGRQIAEELGLVAVGALAVLVRGKEGGHISTVRPLVDRLRAELRFHVSEGLYRDILQRAGEL